MCTTYFARGRILFERIGTFERSKTEHGPDMAMTQEPIKTRFIIQRVNR